MSPHGENSESFIRAHVDRLPANTRFITGAYPNLKLEGASLRRRGSFINRAFRRIKIATTGKSADFYTINDVADRFRSLRLDAVLAEYGPTGASIVEVCERAKLPLVVHFHGYDAYHQQVLKEYSSQYQEMFRYSAAIVAVSRHMMQQLATLGVPPQKLRLNPCGVDLSLFDASLPERSTALFVSVARFVDKKAPHLTLMAFEKVNREISDTRLVMVGDGPLKDACIQLAKSLRIEHAVEFRGAMAHSTIAGVLKNARVFVQHSIQTSYGDSEGTPVAILEAAACGLPVVSTRHAGIIDAVKNEKTGFLVNEGDIEQMAHYMIELARNPDLAGKLGKAAREHITKNYSMELSIRNLWNILQEAIQSK